MVKVKEVAVKTKNRKRGKKKHFKAKNRNKNALQKKMVNEIVGPKFMENDEENVNKYVKPSSKNGKAIPKNNRGKKRKLEIEETEEEIPSKVPLTRHSDDPIPKKNKWINKQRVLVFGCRGISHRDRHLMVDMRTLLPHSRPENKMERREHLFVVNEICEMKNCNKSILFEGRLKRDIYLWLSNVPTGPSVKFLLENVYTMEELKFTGNCLIGSRPLLSFDNNFEIHPHYKVLKELFIQIFGTPNHHPKSQPFIDHVFTFTVLDNRIWFRNYQILSEDGALVEIGPRFVMNPVKIFAGSFGGETLWENPFYVTPSKHRHMLKKMASGKYVNRVQHKVFYESTKPKETYKLNETDNIFATDSLQQARDIVTNKYNKKKPKEKPKRNPNFGKKLKKQKHKNKKEKVQNKKNENTVK